MRDSSAEWVDPFSDAEIRASVQSSDSVSCGGFVHSVRAKSIRLGETATPTQSRESNRNSNLVSIDGDNAARLAASQHGNSAQVRELTVVDEKILASLERRNGFATAKEIRDDVKSASLFTVRSRLDRLVADGRVLSVPGRGYRLLERV